MFEIGYLSKAPLFMDIVTTYFTFLPILLLFAINLAKQKKIKLHIFFQLFIYLVSMLVVVFFEVSIRINGGFNVFLEVSNTPKDIFLIFLSIHILVAIITLISWSVFIFKTFIGYKRNREEILKTHKRKAIVIFTLITLTSYSGTAMYYLLFIN